MVATNPIARKTERGRRPAPNLARDEPIKPKRESTERCLEK